MKYNISVYKTVLGYSPMASYLYFFILFLPDELIGLVKCNNPKCITNNEPMLSRFHVIDKEKGTIKCHYCERKINKEDIIIK